MPGPHLAKSAVYKGTDFVLPVASNAAEILPSYMTMPWLSIERVCSSLHIIAGAASATGQTIEGRRRYYSQWFKIVAMAKPEQWKARAFSCDSFYIELRTQMGRVASAHLGQRTSYLIAAIAMRRAAQVFRQRVQDDQVPEQIAR